MTAISTDAQYYYYYNNDNAYAGNSATVSDDESIFYYTDTTEETYAVSSSTGNTCTDGSDDGKIGILGALGSAVKGIGKTIVNGIKGMFTDSEGKFSLGKTLLSAATIAACVVCPAVGVAACGVGAVMGAATVVKGAYNAATAETDAEAKDAWENIGGGAFTVAASVAGAKSGLNAMKSSAAANGGSALSSLDDSASLAAKVKAFGSDAVSSTKYNLSQAKTGLSSAYNSVKDKSLSDAVSGVKETASNTASKASSAIKNVSQQVKENGLTNTIKSITQSTGKTLSSTGKAILQDITSTEGSYAQAVQKYGYENVLEVIEFISGTEIASESV